MSENIKENMQTNGERKNNKTLLIALVSIIAFVVIVGIVVIVIMTIRNKQKEGYSKSTKASVLGGDKTIEINGNRVDCTPEINYMTEFINTSKGLS